MEWIVFLIALAAGWLLVLGIRGRRVGVAFHCAACNYELSGIPLAPADFERRKAAQEAAPVCPECGTRLDSEAHFRTGRLVRRPGPIIAGSVLLLLLIAGVVTSQLSVVQNFRWMEHKPESWLVPDAIKAYDTEIAKPGSFPYVWSTLVQNPDLVELQRRAEAKSLSDETLLQAVRIGTAYMQTWSPVDRPRPLQDRTDSDSIASWASLGGIALHRDMLTREERIAYCTATLGVGVRTPEKVVRGDPLPVEFVLSAWSVDWRNLTGEPWPTNWGPGLTRFTLVRATVDGAPIDLFQFQDGDDMCGSVKSWRIMTPPGAEKSEAHPRADFAPGPHVLRVEMIARLPSTEPMISRAAGPFASLDELGFPDAGWPIVVESTFTVVETGPAREATPMVGSFSLDAVLRDWGAGDWSIGIEAPMTSPPPDPPAWAGTDNIFAARASLRIGATTTELGPCVLQFGGGFGNSFELTPHQARAILAAPTGDAVLVLTYDPQLAKLVTTPGRVIETGPIELPIKRAEGAGSDGP
jgi:hypothetical protein